MANSKEPGPDNAVSKLEKDTASPGSLLKHGHDSDNPQSSSYSTKKLFCHVSSGGAEKSSYGSFLATEETNSFLINRELDRDTIEPGKKTTSGLAFVNVSYQVPPTFGWLPGNTRTKAKIILRPTRYVIFLSRLQAMPLRTNLKKSSFGDHMHRLSCFGKL